MSFRDQRECDFRVSRYIIIDPQPSFTSIQASKKQPLIGTFPTHRTQRKVANIQIPSKSLDPTAKKSLYILNCSPHKKKGFISESLINKETRHKPLKSGLLMPQQYLDVPLTKSIVKMKHQPLSKKKTEVKSNFFLQSRPKFTQPKITSTNEKLLEEPQKQISKGNDISIEANLSPANFTPDSPDKISSRSGSIKLTKNQLKSIIIMQSSIKRKSAILNGLRGKTKIIRQKKGSYQEQLISESVIRGEVVMNMGNMHEMEDEEQPENQFAVQVEIDLDQQNGMNIEERYMQRADILNKLMLNPLQHSMIESFPSMFKGIRYRFYDQQFQSIQAALAHLKVSWISDFKFETPLTDFFSFTDLVPMQASSQRAQCESLTTALNFLVHIDKELLRRIFQAPSHLQPTGVYSLWLCHMNCFKSVIIDDRIPSIKDRPLFIKSWKHMAFPMLLEKGLAKLLGSYNQVWKLSPGDIVKMVTGGPCLKYRIQNLRGIRVMEQAFKSGAAVILEKHVKQQSIFERLLGQSRVVKYCLLTHLQRNGKNLSASFIDSTGQRLNLKTSQIIETFKMMEACFIRPDHYYCYQQCKISQRNVLAVTFRVKTCETTISAYLPIASYARLNLYKINKNILHHVRTARSCSSIRQIFFELFLLEGEYVLFVEIGFTGTVESMTVENYIPKIVKEKNNRQHKMFNVNLAFLTRKPLSILSIEQLLEEGSGIGDNEKSYLPVAARELPSSPLEKMTINAFLKSRNPAPRIQPVRHQQKSEKAQEEKIQDKKDQIQQQDNESEESQRIQQVQSSHMRTITTKKPFQVKERVFEIQD